jgi:hypothetical protein
VVAMAAAGPTHEVRWLRLDRDLRRRVVRAVRKGQVVSDPLDSPYAVGYAEASLDWFSHRGRLRPFYLLVAIVLVVRLMVTGSWHLASLVYPLVGFGFVKLRAPGLRRRLSTAGDANAELAARARLPAVRVAMPGHAWLEPGSRRRRRLLVSLTVVFVALTGMIVIATMAIPAQHHH